MIQYLEILMNDITTKEIPLLCYEIMSSFYKEEKIMPYFDILTEKLLQN